MQHQPPTVEMLPKNYGLIDLLETLSIAESPPSAVEPPQAPPSLPAVRSESEAQRQGVAWCAEHDEPMKVYCRDDKVLICIYCQIHGRHKDHNCALLKQVAGEHRNSLQQWITLVSDFVDQCGRTVHMYTHSQSSCVIDQFE